MRLLRVLFLTTALAMSSLVGGAVTPTPAAAMPVPAYTFEDVAAIPSLTDVHARVFRLYWAFFDRKPDAQGALYWANQNNSCWSLNRIANFFSTSDEFVATYGTLTNAQYVDLIYRNVLDRAPEPAGRDFWEGELNAGTRTRVQLMLDFAYADEFVANHPLPSDGKTDLGCSTTAPDLPEPSAANAVLASSLPNATLPLDTCPGSTIDPGNNVLVDGRSATNLDGSYMLLATNTDRIVALGLVNVPRQAFADISGDGNVDAVAAIHCLSTRSSFFVTNPVLFVYGQTPVRLDYTSSAGLTSGEEPVGVRAVLARQDRIVFSWAASFNFPFSGRPWNDEPCCPSIEFMSEVTASPTPNVTMLDKYSPQISARAILDAATRGDDFIEDVDALTLAMLREWLPAGSTYSDFQCTYVAVNVIRCGAIASTGPAIQFDLGITNRGRWVTSSPMAFI